LLSLYGCRKCDKRGKNQQHTSRFDRCSIGSACLSELDSNWSESARRWRDRFQVHLVSRVLKCPSLAFGEASNALAVVELPTDAEKPTHTRFPRHSFFQAIGANRGALIAAHSAHRPCFLFAPLFFLCAYRQLSGEKFRAWIAEKRRSPSRSTPLPHRFCLSSCAFPFPKVDRCRHLIASRKILPFSGLRYTPFPTVSSASSHRQRFLRGSQLVD